jgi:hypothetical protein
MTATSPARCTVVFVAPERPRARSLGSGTLVSLGTLNGILTAAHVLENLQTVEEIGFAEFTIRPAQPQGLRFPTKAIDSVKIGGQPYSGFGPDLAFIRLPDHIVATLKVNSSFLNLVQQARMSSSSLQAGAERHDVVVGGIEEWGTVEPDESAGLDMGIVTGLMNEGRAIEIAAYDGYDRIEFIPQPEPGFPLPRTYGGTSGGGLWQLYGQSMDDGTRHLVQSHLSGVAFFQSDIIDGSRTIICHGPKSIYGKLLDKIRARWNDDAAAE